MKKQPPAQLDRLARLMQWFCLGAIGVIVLAFLWGAAAFLGDPGRVTAQFPGVTLYPEVITRTQIVFGLLINLVTLALFCRGLYALWAMFGAFRLGDMISVQTSALMRTAGGAFLLAALWDIVADTVTILILTAGNPPGERQLAISLSGDQFFPVLLAGVLYAIGHVMTVAADIDAENREFI